MGWRLPSREGEVRSTRRESLLPSRILRVRAQCRASTRGACAAHERDGLGHAIWWTQPDTDSAQGENCAHCWNREQASANQSAECQENEAALPALHRLV